MSYIRMVRMVAAFCVAGLVAAAGALAWGQTYVSGVAWSAGQSAQSGFNYSISHNIVGFENTYGGLPQMGTRYVKSDGSSSYSWMWSNTGYLADYRSGYSYGAAQCKANPGNGYLVWVSYCYTGNG